MNVTSMKEFLDEALIFKHENFEEHFGETARTGNVVVFDGFKHHVEVCGDLIIITPINA